MPFSEIPPGARDGEKMAGKVSQPTLYECTCGYERTGSQLVFCERCGDHYSTIDGKQIFAFVAKCDCADPIDGFCNDCGTVPTPLDREELRAYQKEVQARHDEIKQLEQCLARKRRYIETSLEPGTKRARVTPGELITDRELRHNLAVYGRTRQVHGRASLDTSK